MANIRGGKSNYEQDTGTTVVDNQFSPEEVSEKVFNTGGDKTIGELYNAGVFNQSEPTVGQYSDFSAPSYSDPYGDAVKQNLSFADFNENQVRSDVLSQFQGETNATKAAYAQLLKNVRQEGKGRLGENTAVQARRGLLGSDFGAGQTAETKDFNQSQEEKVLAAQAAALAGIKSNALQLAQQEVTARRAAKQQGSQAYLSYLSGAGERKQNNLNTIATSFLSQGVDPMSISPQELEAIAGNFGVTTDDIVNSYIQGKTAQEQAEAERQAELQKELSFNLSEGQARYQYNPETGETELVASRAKTYAPRSSGGGTGTSGGNAGGVSDLTNSVLEGIVNLKDLAPTQRATVAAEISRSERGGELNAQKSQYAAQKRDNTLQFVNTALSQIEDLDGGALIRVATAKIPGTDAYDFAKTIDTIKANIGFEELQAMRAASPTGGALGQVAVQELNALQSILGSLDIGQDREQIRTNLQSIQKRLNGWANAVEQSNAVNQQAGGVTMESLRQEFPNATEEELKEVLAEEQGM